MNEHPDLIDRMGDRWRSVGGDAYQLVCFSGGLSGGRPVVRREIEESYGPVREDRPVKLESGDACTAGSIAERAGLWGKGAESVADGVANPDVKGDPEYLGLLDKLRDLHLAKAADYGSGKDPIANLRASVNLGIPPWVGCMLRCSDKMQRVYSLLRNGSLRNEPIEDNLLDMAAYCLLALRLYKEEKAVPA